MDFEEFYAERVVQFERERKIFKDYTALVTPERNESHNLEWENRKLDNAAGDVKVEVDRYARESKTLESQIQATINEINSLKSSRDARREQINRLSKLSNPVQRDVTYIVEERFTAKRASSAPENANQSGKLGSVGPAYKPLKTGELLKMENRLAEETSKTTSYLQDVVLSIREAEEERHRYRKMRVVSNVAALSEAKGLYLQVDETEAQSFLAVSELLRLRVSIMIAQREEIEQLELLQRDKAFFIEREEKTRQQLISDMALMQRRVKSELQESTRDFQKQLSELNVKLKAMSLKEEWLLAEHAAQESDDSGLIEAVDLAKKRYKELRRRNALEMEGYQTEASQLRHKLTQLDRLYNGFLLNRPHSAPAAPPATAPARSTPGQQAGAPGKARAVLRKQERSRSAKAPLKKKLAA